MLSYYPHPQFPYLRNPLVDGIGMGLEWDWDGIGMGLGLGLFGVHAQCLDL